MTRCHLGFPVKVLGAPLRSHDSRRWQNQPHLSVSLAYVRDIFEYLQQRDIRFYRLAGQLAPYVTHPALPQFHRQLEESSVEMAALGDLARQHRLRLTLHPAHYVQLSSPEPVRVERSLVELETATMLLDAMGLGPEAVLVVHVGGVYEGVRSSCERFVVNVDRLSHAARQRIALENDDRHFGIDDLLWIHRHTGVRLVFDTLHHRCHNPAEVPVLDALQAALATWPGHQQPKVHFSSPRTALREVFRDGRRHLQAPLVNQHSDFIHPFEFVDFMRAARDASLRSFDIMLEAKAKDVALLRLREQLARYAPDLTAWVH